MVLIKHFIEEGLGRREFKSLFRTLQDQHRGDLPHGTYLRPTCERWGPPLSKTSVSATHVNETWLARVADGSLTPPRQNTDVDVDNNSDMSLSFTGAVLREEPEPEPRATPAGHAFAAHQYQSLYARKRLETLRDNHLSHPSPQPDARSDFFLSMPYIHFERTGKRAEMQDEVKKYQKYYRESRRARPTTDVEVPPGVNLTLDQLLLHAHLGTYPASLHIRRTLDQYFHRTIDTKIRDFSQVVHRYQKRMKEELTARPTANLLTNALPQACTAQPADAGDNDPEAMMVMVDQMWMWIVGENLILTSFPRAWGRSNDTSADAPVDVMPSIREHIESSFHEPVWHIAHLATIIVDCCSTAMSRHGISDDEQRVLEIFEDTIGRKLDEETEQFAKFRKASRSLSALRTMKQDRQDENRQEINENIDTMLDISPEISLIEEAKDIRDELEMLKMVLDHRLEVIRDMKKAFLDAYTSHKQRLAVYLDTSLRHIDRPLGDINRMRDQTNRLENAIRHLLDLKQKHASAIEARSAREQAYDTAEQTKSGQTLAEETKRQADIALEQNKHALEQNKITLKQNYILLAFTIVTIIFLPLSFLAAFFDLDITEFPHNADGDQELSMAFAAKYIFGVGIAIAAACVIFAVNFESFENFVPPLKFLSPALDWISILWTRKDNEPKKGASAVLERITQMLMIGLGPFSGLPTSIVHAAGSAPTASSGTGGRSSRMNGNLHASNRSNSVAINANGSPV